MRHTQHKRYGATLDKLAKPRRVTPERTKYREWTDIEGVTNWIIEDELGEFYRPDPISKLTASLIDKGVKLQQKEAERLRVQSNYGSAW